MFLYIKRLIVALFIFVIPVLSANSFGCFLPEQFGDLKSSITTKYFRQMPILLTDTEIVTEQNALFLLDRRGALGTGTSYEYLFDAFFIDGQFDLGSLKVKNAFRGSSDVSGSWAMFIDLLEMMQKIRDLETQSGAFPDLGISRYVPQTIEHEGVINRYLKPLIQDYLTSSGGSSAEVMRTDPFFEKLVDHMPPDVAAELGLDSTGHNGSQTKRVVDLMNMEMSALSEPQSVEIEKIVLENDDSLINMAFHLDLN